MSEIIKFVCLLFLLLSRASLLACMEAVLSTDLTLQKAVQIALAKNVVYLKALDKVKDKKNIWKGKIQEFWLPNVAWSGGYKYHFLDELDEAGAPGATDRHEWSTSLSVEKTLYAFGRLSGEVDVADAEYKKAKMALLLERANVLRSVQLMFRSIWYQKKKCDWSQEFLSLLKKNVEYGQFKFDNGNLDQADFLNLQIRLEEQQNLLRSEQQEYQKLRDQLFVFLQMDVEKDGVTIIESNEGWDPVASVQLRLNYLYEQGGDLKGAKEIAEFPYKFASGQVGLKEGLKFGLKHRFDYVSLQFSRKGLKGKKKVASSYWKPSVGAFGNASISWNTENSSRWQYNVGVNIDIPLFEMIFPWSRSHVQETSLQYELDENVRKIHDLKIRMEKELKQAKQEYEDALSAWKAGKKILDFSEQQSIASLQKYEKGLQGYLDYHEDLLAHQERQVAYLEATQALHVKFLELEKVLGV